MNNDFVQPTAKYLESWKSFVSECDEKNINGFWDYPSRPSNWAEYINQESERRSNSKGLFAVRSSTFWLVKNNEIVAITNIRHELNAKLKKHGGHIGYFVRPSQWKNGYGTKILSLALQEAKKIGINKAWLTCDDSNVGSYTVMEKNGGILEKKEVYNGELCRYYSIKV